MDWKIFFASFWVIFVAELGDRTQLATLTLSTESKKPVMVFFASVLGYAVVMLLTILIGGVLVKYIPQHYIKIASGGLFIVLGSLVLFGIL